MLEKMDVKDVSVSKSMEVVVTASEVWQYLIDDHWVIGTTFTNTSIGYNFTSLHIYNNIPIINLIISSFSALYDVDCVLSTCNENVNYKLQYFVFDADSVTMADESINGFSSFLATNTNYNGKLERNNSLTVVGKHQHRISLLEQQYVYSSELFLTASTCLPGFSLNDTEVASLLMTCTVSDRPDGRTEQINLGSVVLKFQDLSQTLKFQPSTLGYYSC